MSSGGGGRTPLSRDAQPGELIGIYWATQHHITCVRLTGTYVEVEVDLIKWNAYSLISPTILFIIQVNLPRYIQGFTKLHMYIAGNDTGI